MDTVIVAIAIVLFLLLMVPAALVGPVVGPPGIPTRDRAPQAPPRARRSRFAEPDEPLAA